VPGQGGGQLRVDTRLGEDRLHALLPDRVEERGGVPGRGLGLGGHAGDDGADDLEAEGGGEIAEGVVGGDQLPVAGGDLVDDRLHPGLGPVERRPVCCAGRPVGGGVRRVGGGQRGRDVVYHLLGPVGVVPDVRVAHGLAVLDDRTERDPPGDRDD